MSNMTWVIYFLSILMNMRDAIVAVAIILCACAVGTVFWWAVLGDDQKDTTEPRRYFARFLSGGIVAIFLMGFFPTQQQIVAMAASEVVMRSNVGENLSGISADAMKLLKVWIARETDKLTKEEPKK